MEIIRLVLLGAIKEVRLMFKVKSYHESLGGEQVQSDKCPQNAKDHHRKNASVKREDDRYGKHK